MDRGERSYTLGTGYIFYFKENALRVGGVKVGRRFVEEQETRALGYGTGETYHLALSIAKLCHGAVGEVGYAHEVEGIEGYLGVGVGVVEGKDIAMWGATEEGVGESCVGVVVWDGGGGGYVLGEVACGE